MKKFCRYILIAFIGIYDDERRKGYATEVIKYLLDRYDVDGIVGEVVCSDCAEKFWDNVFKVFNCEKYNVTHFHNTIGSFVINRPCNENFPDEDFVSNCLYEASKI